jgi:hypothetical protein
LSTSSGDIGSGERHPSILQLLENNKVMSQPNLKFEKKCIDLISRGTQPLLFHHKREMILLYTQLKKLVFTKKIKKLVDNPM